MNPIHQLVRYVFLAVVFSAGFNLSGKAQEERYAASPLRGTLNQIAKDSSNIVEDTVFFNLSLRPTQATNSVKNYITFKINEFANLVIPDSFKVSISFKVYYSKLVGTSVVLDSTALNTVYVDYNKNKTYQNKAVFKFSGGYRSQVKIFSVTSDLGTFSDYKNVLMLENEIVVNRIYDFDPNVNTVQSITGQLGSLDGDSCSSAGEYTVSWGKVNSATEYDLEWTYVDSSAVANFYKPSTTIIDPVVLFRNNATRVTVTKENFQVPLLYDNGGILFYRVRPVQTKNTGQRVEGQWSSFYSGGLGQYGFAGHENKLNWQATTSFAEEGKRKSVVQYFDGTLRNRQTATKDNSTCYSIVAETIYDYQGRPAIQVMPAPTLSNMIGYVKNFNLNASNSAPYDKTIFDGDASVDDNNCSAVLPGMGNTISGASRYYSANNGFVNNSNSNFIPDAGLYPFTETRYTADNTGRIAMQSGVGAAFAINSTVVDTFSHETRYFYGSADQEDLDALFGTEAGNASHYSKNMVRDANGQYSVSYVDMHGRTIATALAGKPRAKLDSLQTSNVKLIAKKLIDSTNNLTIGASTVASKNLLVTRAGTHRFQYAVGKDTLMLKACDSTNLCYDCLYDLEITISNDCANPNNQPITIRRTNFALGKTVNVVLGDTIAQLPVVDTSIFLSEGSYSITKVLSVSQRGFAAYSEVFLNRNTCRTLQQLIDSVKTNYLNGVQCTPTCQSCLDSLGTVEEFRQRYMRNNNIDPVDSASFRDQALIAYQTKLNDCNELCGSTGLNTSIRQQMLDDMTPPTGQYAELDSFTQKLNIFYYDRNPQLNRYKQNIPAASFKDDAGKIDSIINSNGVLVPVTDPSITPEDFIDNWKPGWAEALLPLHPEYCKLVKMETYAASYRWDERFGKIETFKQAVDSGFINPAGYTQSGSGSESLKNLPTGSTFAAPLIAAKDPFSTLEPTAAAALKDSLFNYMTYNGSQISAWSMATIMAHCPERDMTCVNSWKGIGSAFTLDTACSGELDFAWKYFREIYLSKKAEKIEAILNAQQCNGGNDIKPWNTLNFNPLKPQDVASGIPADSTAAVDSLRSFISSNCAAYTQQWLDEMRPCNLTPSDTAQILPRLRAVCNAGGDGDHLYGANTSKPGTSSTPYQDTSFIQVLKSVLGSRYDSTCNALLITAPKPYDKQPAYADIAIYRKPDSCQCTKINTYYTQYQQSTGSTSFSDFILKRTGVHMSTQTLDSLRGLCNGQITCNFLQTPLLVPAALQCGSDAVCASCADVNLVYNRFKNDFPGFLPTFNDSDSFQAKRNRLFENYMNNSLGLSKSAIDYLTFMNKCGSAGLTTSCDTLLSIVNNFINGSKPGRIIHRFETQEGPYYNDLTVLADTGSIRLPDSIRAKTDTWYNNYSLTLANSKTFCTNSGYSVEIRFKFLINNKTGHVFYTSAGGLDFTAERYTSGAATGISAVINGVRYIFDSNPSAITNWMTFRWKVTPTKWSLYYNNTLVLDSIISSTIPNRTSFGLGLYGRQGCIDRVRVWDNADNLKYDEDFNYPADPAYVDSSFVCPASSCTSSFRTYFNTQKGTNYTYEQIDSVYMANCGVHPVPCSYTTPSYAVNGLMLCPSPAPFTPVTVEDNNPCSDSTLISVGVGSKLYNAYKDSLMGSFGDKYLNKCLKLKSTETFTVTAPVSEFHYTLYYYDQAGNLVKTIPPEGVDVSKFGWAALYSDTVKLARKNGTLLTPTHTLATLYRYNTLNAVVSQYTPDAGVSTFYYDRVGRLALSQNARQKAAAVSGDSLALYSYTQYDNFGRIAVVGQFRNLNAPAKPATHYLSRTPSPYGTWFNANSASRHQFTKTIYDLRYTSISSSLVQKNLRNRVSYTTLTDTATLNFASATYYSYDVLGNVDTLIQDFGIGSSNIMNSHSINSNRLKRIVYKYDLISGKVNHVAYQPPRNGIYYPDAFYHRYSYDAENRLTLVETSQDSVVWEKDARYNYYLHGPLARTVLGEQMVQGIDYAYTLQGWLKGVNATNLNPDYDMGADGKVGTANQYTARDAFGFNLNYYANDYTPVGAGVVPFPDASGPLGANHRPLYNGNINSMAVNIGFPYATSQQAPQLYNYSYDQLNRITGMDVFRCATLNTNSWSGMAMVNDYKERVSYDANGNILKYLRQGFGANIDMDNLTYNYTYASGKLVNNKLNFVRDTIGTSAAHSTNYTEDIDDQAAGNYDYDASGNLIKDAKDSISNVEWNVYGKIKKITRIASSARPITSIEYKYDPAGNRILKAVTRGEADSVEYTAYVRDASGNIMATYFGMDAPNGSFTTPNSGNNYKPYLYLTEQSMYGSSRLGVANMNVSVGSAAFTIPANTTFVRGNKFFELSNHLGNVLVTISDKKTGVPNGSNPSVIDYYNADVITANDYYPGGMTISGRKYNQSSSRYRYGFNGKEKDNEDYGEENAYDFGTRIYDPRIGRFLSVDPLTKGYPSQTPYAFAGNNPIMFIDAEGNGPDLPPAYVTWALLTNHPIGTLALLASNNTSPNQLYKWVTKTSSDPMAYFKLKGAFGEAEAFKRLWTDVHLGTEGVGVPSPVTYFGGSHNGLQVDIQTKISSGSIRRGPFRISYTVGVRNYSFDGKENDLQVYGESKKASYTINYEVKTLSPNNVVGYNFRRLAEGIEQTIERSKGTNTIGVLITDMQTWLNVANDEVYGPQLRALYNKLISTKDAYLRLEKNLNNDAHAELMGAYDTIKKAVQENTASKKKTKKKG